MANVTDSETLWSFIVTGHNYEGEWPVCTYFDEDQARRHILHATIEACKIFQKYEEAVRDGIALSTLDVTLENRYDPNMKMGEKGVCYFLRIVPVSGSPKDFLERSISVYPDDVG